MHKVRSLSAGQAAQESKAEAGNPALNDSIRDSSRKTLLEQLASYGFAVDQYSECTIEQLQDLVRGARWLHRTYKDTGDSTHIDLDIHPASSVEKRGGNLCFTEVDKKVLRSLLDSSGKVSSLALSRKLEIPLTTVQRRRKRLESEFLEVSYSLRLDKLGWRKADLLVSTEKGMTSTVGKEILAHNNITRVSKAIGEHTIDLHAESVFRDNKQLMDVIEWIKSLEGVRDVVWTEPVEMVGKNNSMQHEIIDKHL